MSIAEKVHFSSRSTKDVPPRVLIDRARVGILASNMELERLHRLAASDEISNDVVNDEERMAGVNAARTVAKLVLLLGAENLPDKVSFEPPIIYFRDNRTLVQYEPRSGDLFIVNKDDVAEGKVRIRPGIMFLPLAPYLIEVLGQQVNGSPKSPKP